MNQWTVTARKELAEMRQRCKALPLLDALQMSLSVINRSKFVIDYDQGLLMLCPPDPNQRMDMKGLLGHVTALHRGMDLAVELDMRMNVACNFVERTVPQILYNESLPDPASRLKSIMENVASFRRTTSVSIGEVYDGLFWAPGGQHEVQLPAGAFKFAKNAVLELHEAAMTIVLTQRVLCNLADVITPDNIDLLLDVLNADLDKVRRFARLDRLMKQNGQNRRMLFREVVSIACPKGLGEMRAAWNEPVWRNYAPDAFSFYEPEPGTSVHESEASIRPAGADAEVLQRDYPNLFRRMMKPKGVELEMRALRNMVHRLMRQGVDAQHIADCVARGVRKEHDIAESYGRLDVSAGPTPVQETNGYKWVYCRPVQPAQPVAAAPACVPHSKDAFLASIVFSTGTDAHIRAKGFRPTDIVFAICKGFDFGTGQGGASGAVGAGHYRGVFIRKNIRRYLRNAYRGGMADAPTTDAVISFLKSMGLVIEYRSTVKTKDDAMSINTSPSNPVGADIISTLNASFFRLRSNGRHSE